MFFFHFEYEECKLDERYTYACFQVYYFIDTYFVKSIWSELTRACYIAFHVHYACFV